MAWILYLGKNNFLCHLLHIFIYIYIGDLCSLGWASRALVISAAYKFCNHSLIYWFTKVDIYDIFCLFSLAKGEMSHGHPTLSVSAPHLFYTCPEGATAKLVCTQRGAALHSTDLLRHNWLFTPHSDQHCTGRTGPRHATVGHSHGNHSLPPGLQVGSTEHGFWLILQNVTHADQGRYCCMVLDFQVDHKIGSLVQKPHSHIVLQVTPRKDIKCIGVNV